MTMASSSSSSFPFYSHGQTFSFGVKNGGNIFSLSYRMAGAMGSLAIASYFPSNPAFSSTSRSTRRRKRRSPFVSSSTIADSQFQSFQSKECADGYVMFQFGVEEEIEHESSTECHAAEQEAMPIHDIDGHMPTLIEDVKPSSETLLNYAKPFKSKKDFPDAKAAVQQSAEENDLKSNTQKGNTDKNDEKITLQFYSGAAMCPHPEKESTGGEDAYFIESPYWIGVADGVGGWASVGVNAGLYARELMSNCAALARKESASVSAKEVICRSAKITRATGSCTALVATLRDQTLHVANIGDSGFFVMREGEVLVRSQPMLHGFNFPAQIGSKCDDPSIAETYDVAVKRGDIVVLGTDGLFDNMYETQIVEAIGIALHHGAKPNETARLLAQRAQKAGLKSEGNSPFSDAALAHGLFYQGGKLDDVTVVVAYIK